MFQAKYIEHVVFLCHYVYSIGIELAISIANTQVQIELLRKKYRTLLDSKEPETLTPLDQ